nr:unnamed protein product [Callosobruchus chinensis]
MDSEVSNTDIICRVCRSEGLVERPLFHPCICTGSIKWIHQECLMQWMRYSRKEYCELCGHRFSFTPIYSPDMPRRLPLKDLAAGLLSSIATAVKALFAGTIDAILTLPFDMLATENLASDIFQGCFVVTCTLLAFAGLVWLREQILHGGGPDWLGRGGGGQREVMGGVREGGEGDEDEEEGRCNSENPDQADDADGNVGEDNNWIPMEWDRAAEEITWERLLGLDGSLMFLEHVFWIISLNTLFILIFAYSPYHMGVMTLSLLNMNETASASHFEGLLTTLWGTALWILVCSVAQDSSFVGLTERRGFG